MTGLSARALVVTLLLLFGLDRQATAQPADDWPTDPQERGLAIARTADERDAGFGDSTAALLMVLRNRAGDESTRTLRLRTLERSDPAEGDWGLVIFDEPRDVRGTALLTHSNILEPDDQWLYLPRISRVKRISSANKAGPFMGSEFSYEDMASREVAKYSWRWLRDEACGPDTDLQCHVLEQIPRYDASGYSRLVSWMDVEELRVLRTDFYDRKGSLLKTLYAGDFRLYLDQYWRAHDVFMENMQTGKSTRLIWGEFLMREGANEADFTLEALKAIN